jgi:hypothetical protein
MLRQLHRTIDDPAAGVRGMHVYTFNQIREAAEWHAAAMVRAAAG